MNIVIFGSPYSGKGTQSIILAKHFGIFPISMGDLIREEIVTKSELGLKIQNRVGDGLLIFDEEVMHIMNCFFAKFNLTSNFILEGFPRRITQISLFNQILGKYSLTIDYFVNLNVSVQELLKRAANRKQFSNRSDDNNLIIHKQRIELFYIETLPVINHYRKNDNFIEIIGDYSIHRTTDLIIHKMKKPSNN
jgi:adenylate kinase